MLGRRSMRFSLLIFAGLISACSASEKAGDNEVAAASAPEAAVQAMPESANSGIDGSGNEQVPLAPPKPGQPGGLADDRTPVSEAPFAETSAQGAANVVQTYYALVEAGKYAEARRLWADSGRASGESADAFAANFARYREYHANVGAPGLIEGGAGSLYVQVPVQPYGRLKDGKPFNERGTVTLRRVNNVDGSTAEQRRWHIASYQADGQP